MHVGRGVVGHFSLYENWQSFVIDFPILYLHTDEKEKITFTCL